MVTSDSPKKAATGRPSRNDPPGQDWHAADVKAALEKAGWSLRGLARANRYKAHGIARALYEPAPVAELIIATTIGVHPKEIWPSRYDHAGHPKGRIRPGYDPETIARQRRGHVPNREAA